MRAKTNIIHVLHVDDEPDFGAMAAEFLEREDDRIAVQTATNTQEGLEQFADSDIDCIVSDFNMPGQNGIEFLESIRENHPDLPFILYTGKGSEEVASEAINAGVTKYLQKESGTEQYEILANDIVSSVQKHRTEQELDQLRRQYTKLVEQNFVGIYIIQHGEFVYVNPRLAGIHGFDSPDEIIGLSPLELVAPSERDRVQTKIEQRLAGEKREIQYQTVGLRQDGERIDIELHGSRVEYKGDTAIIGVELDITEEKERERELERQAAFLEEARDTLVVLDAEGTVQYMNATTEKLTGFSPEQVIGQDGFEHVHPDDQAEIRSFFDSFVAESETEATRELRVQTTEGSWRWLESRYVNKLDDPLIEGVIVSSQDITERKEREEEIAHLKERLELAVEGASLGVWDWDMNTDKVEFNEHWAAMLGYSLHEFEPHINAWEKRVHPEDLPEVEAALEAHLTNETNYYDTEHRMRTADGDWKWIRDIGQVVERDDDGDPIRAVGIHQDITDRKERERELRVLKERYQILFDKAPEMIVLHDNKGDIHEVNQQECRNLGYSEEELTSMNIADIDPSLSREEVQTLLEGIDVDETKKVETKLERKNRSTFPVEVWVVKIEQEVGVRCLAFARDITDRKGQELELRREKDRLDDFASVVSHDLRNPLNVALGRVNLAQDECDSDHLDAAVDGIERSLDLIEDMLELARTGQEVSEVEPIELAILVDACWDTVVTNDAELKIEDGATIQGNRTRLRQLLENLFRNAVEHGADDVTVRVGSLPNGFYVEDDGPGIPEGEREDVWEAGYSKTTEGTGFGLSIVQQIVKAHDWDIRITEGSAGGARFEITGVPFAAE